MTSIDRWWASGEGVFADAVAEMGDEALDGPSLLPGWARRMVVAHVARNADALGDLLTWARTRVETPMYESPEARAAGIATSSEQAPVELRADSTSAAARFHDAVLGLPEVAWAAEVRTAQGLTVPASEVLWMRCREVWIHAVDLDAGPGFADMPTDLLVAFVDDVVGSWRRRDSMPDVTITDGSRSWGTGSSTVEGDLPELVAHLIGRDAATGGTGSSAFPELPSWM